MKWDEVRNIYPNHFVFRTPGWILYDRRRRHLPGIRLVWPGGRDTKRPRFAYPTFAIGFECLPGELAGQPARAGYAFGPAVSAQQPG